MGVAVVGACKGELICWLRGGVRRPVVCLGYEFQACRGKARPASEREVESLSLQGIGHLPWDRNWRCPGECLGW